MRDEPRRERLFCEGERGVQDCERSDFWNGYKMDSYVFIMNVLCKPKCRSGPMSRLAFTDGDQ